MATTTRSLTVNSKAAGGHDCPCGCAPCEGACCRLDCLVQPRFFCGQLLTDHDLTALVGWARDKFALATRRDGWGVVCGLDVRCAADERNPLRVRVTPGYAVSCCGDDVVVCEETVLDLSDACREEADPCADLRRQLRETRDGGQAARAGAGRARAYGLRAAARADAPRDLAGPQGANGGDGNGGGDGDGDELENFRAVDIFLRYAEKPAGPSTAFGRSACSEAAECEYSRTEESYALGWQFGEPGTDPVERAARRWHEGYEKCLAVLKDFRAQFSFQQPPNGESVRRWLVGWIDQHPLAQFCHLRDEICRATVEELRDQGRLTRWLFGLVQDCRNAYLACDCAGCERDRGVPLARVWLRTLDGRWGRESCRVAQIDPYPPYRRPLRKDCWPAPLGYVNVGRAVWHRWEEACAMLDDLGLDVERAEFEVPDTLEELETALGCDLFVECDERRTALVYDAGPLGRRVVGFCVATAPAPPAVTLDIRCERFDSQTHTFVPTNEAQPSDFVQYVFTATNPSSLDLSDVTVRDTATGFNAQNEQLAAGATRTWTSVNIQVNKLTQSGGAHNEANISGRSADGQTVTDTAAHDLAVIRPPDKPSVSIDKTGPRSARPLETVVYTFSVTNTGQTPLSVEVSDDRLGPLVSIARLLPGQAHTFERAFQIPRAERGELTNRVTALGRDDAGLTVTATDTHTLTINTTAPPPGPGSATGPRPIDGIALARDDFTIIRGIGEARAGSLHEAGINTFAQLADTPLEELRRLFGTISEEVLRQWVADAKALAQ